MKAFLFLSTAAAAVFQRSHAMTATIRTLSQHHKLHEYVSAVSTETLDMSLNIQENGSHLCVNGMSLKLLNEKIGTSSRTVKMPGVDGPLPQLSSGLFPIQLVNLGSYVDMNGRQSVHLENPIWELCWSDGAPSGNVIMGFTVPRDYSRNAACLSSSSTYFCTFRVFTREGLVALQQDKIHTMQQVQALQKVRQVAIDKVRSTNNPIIKATEYRKAIDAMERLSYYDLERLELIPADNEVIPLGGSVMIANSGQLWSRSVDGKQLVHGTAFVSSGVGPTLAP